MKLMKSMLKNLTPLFQSSSFFLQGQMDIHPKSRWHDEEFKALTGGFFIKNDPHRRTIVNLEPWDNTRRDMIVLLLRTLAEKSIPGAMAELGVFRGGTAKLIHHYAPERPLYLFDTFEGFPERNVAAEEQHTSLVVSKKKFSGTSMESVKRYIAQQNNNVLYFPGCFPDSIPEGLHERTFAFVHLDADLYEPIHEALRFFYPRMSERGMILVHDYNAWPGARNAVDDYFAGKRELPIPMPDKSGSALIVKAVSA